MCVCVLCSVCVLISQYVSVRLNVCYQVMSIMLNIIMEREELGSDTSTSLLPIHIHTSCFLLVHTVISVNKFHQLIQCFNIYVAVDCSNRFMILHLLELEVGETCLHLLALMGLSECLI